MQRIEAVSDFWSREACGSHFIDEQKFTPEFYEKYRNFRYSVEHHLKEVVPFASTKGQKVLEIGVGNGADGTLFAQAGADYTGVDLTETALEASRRHFEILGLQGTFQRENAERLSFPDHTFDFVYSHGVLHHTPNPQNAFDEVWRVLKPGGRAVLMLYHKHSFNYYVRILGWMRLKALLHGAPLSSLRASEFVHHATDGPDCPIAETYTKKSARAALCKFPSCEMKVRHFPIRKSSPGFPLFAEKALARTMGWYLFIFLSK